MNDGVIFNCWTVQLIDTLIDTTSFYVYVYLDLFVRTEAVQQNRIPWFSNQNVNLATTFNHFAIFFFIFCFCFNISRAKWFNVYFAFVWSLFHHEENKNIVFLYFFFSYYSLWILFFFKQMSSWNGTVYSGQSTSKSMPSVPIKKMFANGNEQRW